MKKLALFAALAAISLGFSSCCSMFGMTTTTAGHRTETRQVKTCKTDTVTEHVRVAGSSAKGDTYEVVEKKVPRYRTVTRRTRIPCGSCVRFYCPKKDCCGTTSDSTRKMATAQPSVGSPLIGLIPTMRTLAP